MKHKTLVTAEVNKEQLENGLTEYFDFIYDGYSIDHNVMPHDELISKIKDVDVLICEYDTISSDVIDAAEKLKLIVCCRGGVKSVIDIEATKRKGILVCNNVGRNAGAVTDMVMGYILDLTRNISYSNSLIHSKELTMDVSSKPTEYQDTVWGLDNDSPFIKYRGHSINHMTLGIVGYGHAGKLLAKKAEAFGMKILAYDPYADFSTAPDYISDVSLGELLECSDIVSLHCISTKETRDMFSINEFKKMKKTAYFINTSRGDLVVEEDLVDALKNNMICGAAIDVTRKEPISSDSILLTAPNLLITPHIAGSADDVQYCGTEMVRKSLTNYIKGETPAYLTI